MCLRTRRNRLSGRYRRTRNTKNGPEEDTRGSGLVSADHHHQSTPILGIHRVLLVLYPKLLEDYLTTPRPHKEDNPMALGQTPIRSIRNFENPHGSKTRATPAQLRKAFLPSNRCLRIWRGCHTLTSGRV